GRNDFQVKIRGHRIELGEIEQALLGCGQVQQSLVVVKQHLGQSYLVGYYLSDGEQDEEVLLEQLASRLPEYMVPTRLVHLDFFPLTANGKLDIKNLPEPAAGPRKDHELPSTELERQLSVIWCEVLGLKAGILSVHDDFFRLGGDSIISIQLISRIRQRLQLQVSVKDLFSCRTIRRLHEQLAARCEPELQEMAIGEQGLLSGAAGLLPIQRWFFAQSFTKNWHWNQSFLIKTPALDVGRLRSCVQQLVAHHDAFRLRFRECDGTIEQYYDAGSTCSGLQVLDVRGLDAAVLEEQMTLWQSGFNGSKGPLYCFAYLSGYADGSSRIYVAMHHLLVDAVSWRILADDLQHLYEGRSLGSKGSSYRQWIGALEDYAVHHEQERTYWQEVVADLKEVPALERQPVLSSAELELAEEFTSSLLRETNDAYHTQINDLLLTALAYALNDLSGESVHHVTLEGHGREDIAASIDVTRTVGWFTSLYP
ncbi:condensation domain-containing protein, partial [Legionella sainthelensi]